ncbi:wax ester/triacylglycerol synthase family O-acyltransferase [Rhodococcus sp. ENV425]|uniref:WS/DGAT/MGAT family O-acyltransferase n=1 Tax=Rhodococcus sp. ENV425 TaxID=2042960 RepID=UPI000C9C4D88|nr:wax ester/triacylglycerol synthase family O-acyltransferase [Rhodococcus sp. ENV425]PND51020.1 wax ester/triacylglycerol synthase family O-acyltransferase [Rhodococcus sp. ENV425]
MRLPMSPIDSMFLLGESREHPMHVGGLILLQPPPGGDARSLRALFDAALAGDDLAPLWRRRAVRSLATLGMWAWEDDPHFDLEHHVRRDALPRPGGIAELRALVSRLHSTLLDRSRPLWEMHLIEGLADGRYAIYTKIHHALADGVGAMRLLHRALSSDADRTDMPAPWARFPSADPPHSAVGTALDLPSMTVRAVRGVVDEAAGMVPALVGTVDRALRGRGGAVSLTAPRTMLNVSIAGGRRFAAHDWSLTRLRRVAEAAGATVNDVVLAMSAGALRAYLLDHEALPDDPLVAMVPVSLRRGKTTEGGNDVGVLMCPLATHVDDSAARLAAIRDAMVDGKESMRGRSQTALLATSALGMAPLAVGVLTGNRAVVRPPFNVIVSNVPGPVEPLYWNGARVDALYPLSVPVDGQALNITCTSTDDRIAFGLTSCSRSVPQLDRLIAHLDDELAALERTVGVAGADGDR